MSIEYIFELLDMIEERVIGKLLTSIANDNLIVICGAGLSMASPSDLLSAGELAKHCCDTFQQDTGTDIPLQDKNNLEDVASYFANQHRFVYFIEIVSKILRSLEFNNGHLTIADFLLCKVLNYAISTNPDKLIEQSATSLGEDICSCTNPTDLICIHNENPLLKIHGCIYKDKLHTLWYKNQLEKEPFVTNISEFNTYLSANLGGKDIIILGFWSDWDYLNELLIQCVNKIEPRSVFVVNPTDSKGLEDKAPNLWRWIKSDPVDFEHIQTSADEFLMDLRRHYSKVFLNKIIKKGIHPGTDAEDKSKSHYFFNGSQSVDELYNLRRSFTGVPLNKPVISKIVDDSYEQIALEHVNLMDLGAVWEGPFYKLKGKLIRLIKADGKVISTIKRAFSKEHLYPSTNRPDVNVCVGAAEDNFAFNIVRNDKNNIIRAGLIGEWKTAQEFRKELKSNGHIN